jgi:TPR repeat protein
MRIKLKPKSKPLVANLYNPHEQSKEQLMESFVVRHEVFHELFQDIKSSDMTKPERHYLIEGQRGTGKTTLLLRLSYEIENDCHLRNWLIPIVLKEEAYYGIRDLFRLWETVAQELEVKDRTFSGLTRHMSEAYEQAGCLRSQGGKTSLYLLQAPPPQGGNAGGTPALPEVQMQVGRLRSRGDVLTEEQGGHLWSQGDTLFDSTSYEQICFKILIAALKNRSKKLILFIDNLGEMLQNFRNQENLRFREVLTNCPYLRLIGATPVVFEALQKGNLVSVFYNFFTTIQLEGLDKEETRYLLLELAKASHKEKIIQQIIEHHPGRIEALRILTGGVIRTLVLLFEIFTGSQNGNSITDLNDILDKVTPLYQSRMKELTPLQRYVVNAVALNWDAISPREIAQKTYMSTDNILAVLSELEKVLIVQRVITDNHQHFYQLKERFFNIWYLMRLAPGASRSKVLWLLHFLESWYDKGELIQQARKHTEAIAARRYTPNSAYYLTEAFTKTGKLDMETEHKMIRKTKDLLQERDTTLAAELYLSDKEIFNKAEACYQHEDYENAITLFLKIKHKNDQVYFRIGDSFSKLASYKEAIHYFLKAIEKDHVEAMLHLAVLYYEVFKDYENAKTYYVMAMEKGNMDAMLSLGNLYYHELHEYKTAENYYLMAVKKGRERSMVLTSEKSSLRTLRNYLVKAIKGEVDNPDRYHFNDFNGVKEHYLHTVKRIRAEAMFQLGNLYIGELKNYEKAQMYYLAAMRAGHIGATVNLGFLYHYTFKNYQKALKYYALAVEKGDSSAMNGFSWVYFEQKINKQEALHYAKQAFETEKSIYTAHTLACIYLWNNQPELAFQTAQEFMYDKESYTSINQDILVYLMLLLAKEQYHYLTEYFNTPGLNLQERFKPLYYAFLYYTRDPNYYKRPPELLEPIKGIIGQVQQLAVNYA